MSAVRRNLLANLIGQGWASLMALAFVPVYIRLMGIDAYGLVGFYASLQGILQILDFGLSPTVSRELARWSVKANSASDARDLVRTLEIGYWTIGVLIALGLGIAAPVIATHWIRSEQLSPEVVTRSVISMALVAALQWPLTFYTGGLVGLQRQVLLSVLNIALSTLNYAGAALMLAIVHPSVDVFFQWQVAVSAIRAVLMIASMWHCLPRSGRRPKVRPQVIRSVWRFAAGMTGLSITATILTQSDKIILSRVAGLEAVGYYTIAASVANTIAIVLSPTFNALFPRFAAMVAGGQHDALQQLYHRGSQWVAVLVAPLSITLAVFAPAVILAWTGDPRAAQVAAPIATMLSIGTGLSAITNTPYALQLAYGTTKVNLMVNCVALVVVIPMMLVLSPIYGAAGVAAAIVVMRVAYLLAFVPLTHRLYLRGHTYRWIAKDIGPPTLAALGFAVVAKYMMPPAESRWVLAAQSALALALTYAGSFVSLRSTWSWLGSIGARIGKHRLPAR